MPKQSKQLYGHPLAIAMCNMNFHVHVCILHPITLLHVHVCTSCRTEILHQRMRLDRHRLESAHLKYAILNTQSKYPCTAVSSLPIHTDLSTTLATFTIAFYEAFSDRYSGT